MKVFWNVFFLLRYVQGWFTFGERFCLDWFRVVFQGRFEIVAKLDLGFSLGGFSVCSRFTLDLFNVGVMLI